MCDWIEVAAENGPVTLRLTGREGVKDFVREEIGGLLGNVTEWETVIDSKQRSE